MDNAFYILHFSDLHFGALSLEMESKFKTSFQDFFFDFSKTVSKIIENYKPKIILITGDFTSKGDGKNYNNKYLIE